MPLTNGLSAEQMAKLDGLLVLDPSVGMTPFAWLKAMPIAPKADHIRELLDRLHLVRRIGVPAGNASRVHEDRLQQFVREGHASDAHQLGRYSEHRRRAILVATVLDLETRLTERSASYRRFDSYLLPQEAVLEVAAGLKLPATAALVAAANAVAEQINKLLLTQPSNQ